MEAVFDELGGQYETGDGDGDDDDRLSELVSAADMVFTLVDKKTRELFFDQPTSDMLDQYKDALLEMGGQFLRYFFYCPIFEEMRR